MNLQMLTDDEFVRWARSHEDRLTQTDLEVEAIRRLEALADSYSMELRDAIDEIGEPPEVTAKALRLLVDIGTGVTNEKLEAFGDSLLDGDVDTTIAVLVALKDADLPIDFSDTEALLETLRLGFEFQDFLTGYLKE